MNLPKIQATVHRWITGLYAITTAAIAGVTALDADALGISPEAKLQALGVLAVVVAVVNVLRAQTQPDSTTPPAA